MKKLIIITLLFFMVACQSDGDNTPIANTVEVEPTATAVPGPPIVPAQAISIAANTNTPTATPVDAIALEKFTGYIKRPNYMTHAGEQTLYIVEQAGKIHVLQEGELLEEPFLDITEKVNDYINEQGLLELAFHPNFVENGTFFIYYSTHDSGNTVLARYQTLADNPLRADPTSETILITFAQPDSVHNAGQLQFGPDGYLYIGIGDGGMLYDKAGNAQNKNIHLGSLLRIDVDAAGNGFEYGIPDNNPFLDDSGQSEIWSYGWRNPWRFSFDRHTGNLFVGDVGEFDREEINFQPVSSVGGENYGWNIWEGTTCFQAENCRTDGFTFPIFEYSHQEGCAIIGGYIYRGQAYPELWGNYFLGDYCMGKIWRLFPSEDGSWQADMILDTDYLITSFAEDADGELYVITQQDGIFQITTNN